MAKSRDHLGRNLILIGISLIIAVWVARSPTIEIWIRSLHEFRFLGSFIAGIFFTSIFTSPVATVVLGEIAQTNHVWLVALSGGLGALIGDWVIFKFIRDQVTDDLRALLRHAGVRRLPAIFRLKLFRWFTALVGALIIASPLPDELGLALLGLSQIKTKRFILISFIFNTLGILVIGLIARAMV